jgi:hypothetical protein
MSYTDAKVKHHKLAMDSPVQGNDARGGLVKGGKSPKLGSIKGGKGTQKHLSMEGADLAGGGWVEGVKKEK